MKKAEENFAVVCESDVPARSRQAKGPPGGTAPVANEEQGTLDGSWEDVQVVPVISGLSMESSLRVDAALIMY